MDTLLEEERLRFRENNGLSNEATVFYGLPGEFSIPKGTFDTN